MTPMQMNAPVLFGNTNLSSVNPWHGNAQGRKTLPSSFLKKFPPAREVRPYTLRMTASPWARPPQIDAMP